MTMKSVMPLMLMLVVGIVGLWSQKPFDLEGEEGELLKTHRRDRQAHFQTDADLLLTDHSEEFISVSRGKLNRPKKTEARKMFQAYFRNATYHEWDDLEPPVVRVSNDGSMAWLITRLKVRRTQKDAAGADKEEKFVYAGIMTYEKRDGKWVKTANVSTFE